MIFEGKFTVAGKPGPAGQTIYAEFVHGGSPPSTTFEGEYVRVIVGPVSVDDIELGVISFYLGTRTGDHVKADQTWIYSQVNQPTEQILDLSFPRLPEIFPIKITSDRVESGRLVYSQNCTSCHGPVEGPSAIDAAPVHSDAGHTWHHPDRLLYQWVMDRPPLATIMPGFRGKLSGEEVLDVLAYIKNSWPSDIQQHQNQGSAQYEAQVVENGPN